MSTDFDLDVFSTIHGGNSETKAPKSSGFNSQFMIAGHSVNQSTTGTVRNMAPKKDVQSNANASSKNDKPERKSKRKPSNEPKPYREFADRKHKAKVKAKEALREEEMKAKLEKTQKLLKKKEKRELKLKEKQKKHAITKIAERMHKKHVKTEAQKIRETETIETPDKALHISHLPLSATYNDIADWLITHMKRSKLNRPAPALPKDAEVIAAAKAEKKAQEAAAAADKLKTEMSDETKTEKENQLEKIDAKKDQEEKEKKSKERVARANLVKAAELRQVGITRLRLVENLKCKFKGFGFVSFVDPELKSAVLDLFTKNIAEATRRKAAAMAKEEAKQKAKAEVESSEATATKSEPKKKAIPGGFATFSGLNFLLFKENEVSLQRMESTNKQLPSEINLIRREKKVKVISRLEANHEKKMALLEAAEKAEKAAELEKNVMSDEIEKQKEKENQSKKRKQAPTETKSLRVVGVVAPVANAPLISPAVKVKNPIFKAAAAAQSKQVEVQHSKADETKAPKKRNRRAKASVSQDEKPVDVVVQTPESIILPPQKKLRLVK